jgi:hypothetical protein
MLLGLVVLSFAVSVAAEPRDERDASKQRPSERQGPGERDFHFQGGIGASNDDDIGGAFVQDLLASYRFRHLEAGAFATFGTDVFGPGYATYGVAIGPVLQTASGLRGSLLAQIGADSYTSVGCGLFCERGGASATVPYAGAKLSLSHVFSARGRTHLELGVSGFYGSDLERKEVRYTTTGGLFTPGQTSEQTRTLGGERVGGTVNAGLTFDL